MSDIISSGMIFSTHSKHNLLHGKGKQTAYCLSGSGSNLVKIHLLKLKFSFSCVHSLFFLRSSIRSISFLEAELTNSETDLKPSSEYRSINSLMLKYNSEGILTSLYNFAINVLSYMGIKIIFDIYVERFINKFVFRHICLKRGAI